MDSDPHPVRDLSLVLSLATAARVLVLQLLPMDWNWDSYHHWQISWFSLRLGFPQWRLWDLNGCEYYWGMFPHIVEATIMGLMGSPGIQPYRFLNVVLGAGNAGLVYLIGRRYVSRSIGFWAGLIFAVFPVAAVFDALALQDTLALALLLSSVYLAASRPFWSGVLLGLAGQSRTELLLAAGVIMAWVIIVERFRTERLPMLVGWGVVTVVASYYLYSQTGNPLYNLYWSLYGVFSGAPNMGGAPFIEAMFGWATWKLSVWPTKPTGILILGAAVATPLYFAYTLFRKPRDYQMIYLLPTAAVLAPVFVTYIGADTRVLLIMARMMTPIVALSLPLLLSATSRVRLPRFKTITLTLLVVSAISFYPVINSYAVFQAEAENTMSIADEIHRVYSSVGGNLVCDYPMMNYRLVSRWGVSEESLVSNHYAPQYYDVSEPIEYAKWLFGHGVTVWVRYGEDAEVVYSMACRLSPRLLVEAYESHGIKVYVVDPDELNRILG